MKDAHPLLGILPFLLTKNDFVIHSGGLRRHIRCRSTLATTTTRRPEKSLTGRTHGVSFNSRCTKHIRLV